MIRTIAGLLISLSLLLGVSFYESNRVQTTFQQFNEVLQTLYDKAEAKQVTYEDGTAVEKFWEKKKNTLHILQTVLLFYTLC